MIRAVVDFALSHRWFMLAFGIFLFGMGIIQFHHLSIEAYPDVANNYAWIITQWPGRAAEEVEQQVTIPIENVMSGIPYRTYLRSVSIAGLSVVIIWFDDNSDNFQNRQRVLERLTMVNLPSGLSPGIGPDFSPVGQIYFFTLRSTNPQYDPT
ncbi:MAG TPA: efflux RND transporter permease subunit, partial [Thermodesulfobacteriota bacterium]|nr:efflux RND transporter permease subunit [Thermodesulfobacteriota bacterium]